jgi:hypothetical protein
MNFFKIIIITILFSLKIGASSAQVMPAAGSYTINNTMAAFHGTWRWVSGVDTLVIHLDTKKVPYINFFCDELAGWHLYKHGNTIVQNSLINMGNINFRTIGLHNEAQLQTNIAQGFLDDIDKDKSGRLTLTLSLNALQLNWHLEAIPGIKYTTSSEPLYQYGFTLPRNLVLTKQ